MLIGEPIRFDGFGDYAYAQTVVDRLNKLNPRVPIELRLTSWTPTSAEDTLPAGDKPLYADVVSESPSRIIHFVDELRDRMRQTLWLERNLAAEYKQPLPKPATPEPRVSHEVKGDEIVDAISRNLLLDNLP